MEDANLEPGFYEIADTSNPEIASFDQDLHNSSSIITYLILLMAFRIIESGFIIKRSIIFDMNYVCFQEIFTL